MHTAQATFSKSYRLLKRFEFTRLSASSNILSRPAFLIVWQDFGLSVPRIGITASRKVGSAVIRNRIKRQVREFFRNNHGILPAVDLNLIIRRKAAEMDTDKLHEELAQAFRRIAEQ